MSHCLWVFTDRRALFANYDNDRVPVFDEEGEWLGKCGPLDIWTTTDGSRIYVTEQAPRVICFDAYDRVQRRARTFGVYPHDV